MNLDQINQTFHKYTHWYLGEIINYCIHAFLALELFSNLYNTNFNDPPLFWHIQKGIHHTWDVIGLIVFFLIMVNIYKFNPINALIRMLFILAVHEQFWYVTYYLVHRDIAFIMVFIFTPVNIAYSAIIIFYLYLAIKKHTFGLPLGLISSMFIVYFVWGYFGFPLTVDFFGVTQYFYSVSITVIEIGVWLLAIFSYWLDIVAEETKKSFKR